MVLALSAPSWLPACSDGPRRAVPPPASATTTTIVPPAPPTTEQAPAYAPSPYEWQRADGAATAVGGGAGATIGQVLAASTGQPWLAAGTTTDPAGVPTARVWTSADGRSWSEVALGPGIGQADGAAIYRGQTVVVGSVGEGANQQATAWVSSSPGAPYVETGVPATVGPSRMALVTAGTLGLFAAGTIDGRFALWASSDGRQWNEMTAAEKVFGSSPAAHVTTLLAEGDKVYAAGSVLEGAVQAAAVWSSGDGLHWSLVDTADPVLSGPGGRVIYSLAPLGSGLVAGGAVNRGSGWAAASWISPDGQSWSPASTDFPGLRADGDPAHPASGTAVRAIASIATLDGSPSLLAAGGGSAGQQAWRSTDGLHWSPLGLPADAAASGGWRATLVAGTAATAVVADSTPGQAHVLTGPTGATGSWSEPSADPAAFGPVRPAATPVSLTPSGAGLQLVVQISAAPQSIGNSVVSYVTLESVDGNSWAAAPPRTTGPATVPSPNAVAMSLPTGWVSVGVAPAAEGWTSPTGTQWTSQGALDGAPDTAAPRPGTAVGGICTAGGDVAAVGSAWLGQVAAASAPAAYPGRSAVAWYAAGGVGWKRASVSPAPAAGGSELMTGCIDTGAGLLAYGGSVTAGGTPSPAAWRSPTGTAWNRSPSAFPAVGTELVDAAALGTDVLVVASPDPSAGPRQLFGAGQVEGGAPAAAALTDGGIGPASSLGDGLGRSGLWLSRDGGSGWQLVDTSTVPWLGADSSEANLVSFEGDTPVVAGSVDGRLAIWTATTAPDGSP